MTQRIYTEPSEYSDAQVSRAIKENDIEALKVIPISLGRNHENWKFAQDVCVTLSGHEDPDVRHASIMGLMYTALFKGRLEKNVVKPVILRALKDPGVGAFAEDARTDINNAMGWQIGMAKEKKAAEKRYYEKRKQKGEPGIAHNVGKRPPLS